ncbi:hypothetical protein BDZ89DRAFT_444377 [Hymenopellis radicata]|nr:hypothetical protein BDZ89DRAFT_444377 [Hymenopellis radicata]
MAYDNLGFNGAAPERWRVRLTTLSVLMLRMGRRLRASCLRLRRVCFARRVQKACRGHGVVWDETRWEVMSDSQRDAARWDRGGGASMRTVGSPFSSPFVPMWPYEVFVVIVR